ncbi:hypothetical protein ScPMuIL_003052 [Solemya velum]
MRSVDDNPRYTRGGHYNQIQYSPQKLATMDMSCGGKFGLIFLLILNFIFFLVGSAILTLGVVLKTNSNLLETDVNAMLNDMELNGMKLGNLLSAVASLVIAIGCVIMVISGFGLFGSCCKSRCFLITYAILLLIVCCIQLAAMGVAALMRDKAVNWFDDTFNTLFETEFKTDDITAMSATNKGLAVCSIYFKCCGAKKYDAANNQFEKTPWWPNRGSQKVSRYCCKGITTTNYADYNTNTCMSNPTETDTYINQGCSSAMYTSLEQYASAGVGLLVGISVIQILGVVFACIVARDLKRVGAQEEAMKA